MQTPDKQIDKKLQNKEYKQYLQPTFYLVSFLFLFESAFLVIPEKQNQISDIR